MVILSRPAEIAMDSLLPRDRTQVKKFLDSLKDFPRGAKAKTLIKNLPGFPGLYNGQPTQHLLLFFRYDETQANLTVLDILNPDRLVSFNSES